LRPTHAKSSHINRVRTMAKLAASPEAQSSTAGAAAQRSMMFDVQEGIR